MSQLEAKLKDLVQEAALEENRRRKLEEAKPCRTEAENGETEGGAALSPEKACG